MKCVDGRAVGNIEEGGGDLTKEDGDLTKEGGCLTKDSSKESGSGIESLLHCDSQSSGIFSQESSDRSQCSSRLSWDGETDLGRREERRRRGRRGEDVEEQEQEETQDWRKVRRRSGFYPAATSKAPTKPSTAADMWSFGCLLTEAFTGGKLFRQGDKLAAVLRWLTVSLLK